MSSPLLRIKSLKVYFYTDEGVVQAVNGVDFIINSGENLGIIGESGSGKSVTALTIMRLIPIPPGKIVAGEIEFNGFNLLEKSTSEMRRIRGNEISMIFQDPMSSLNPVFTIGDQIAEAISLHQKKSRKQALQMAVEMLYKVAIPLPEQMVNEYPHQLSGGMRQRAMIAMALSCNPKLLIADEPTTALDVTIQAQILELLKEMGTKTGTSIIMITHNFGVIAEIANKVAVMYAGEIVEFGEVKTIFNNPQHPYTRGLLNSIPSITEKKKKLSTIAGNVPDPNNLPQGCAFHPRCNFSEEICRKTVPDFKETKDGHRVRCFRIKESTIIH